MFNFLSSLLRWKPSLTLSAKNASLHGCAEGHGLIWVDALVGLLAIKELLQELLDLCGERGSQDQSGCRSEVRCDGAFSHLGDARGASDEHNLVQVTLLHVRIVQSLLHGAQGLWMRLRGA